MLHIVCILESYLTYGTWQSWVTQNCTQGFAGPCTREGRTARQLAIAEKEKTRTAELISGRGRGEHEYASSCPGKM